MFELLYCFAIIVGLGLIWKDEDEEKASTFIGRISFLIASLLIGFEIFY